MTACTPLSPGEYQRSHALPPLPAGPHLVVLDGTAVDAVVLRDGDVIAVGRVRLPYVEVPA